MDMCAFSPLFAAHPLVTVNAALNGLATLLLLAGYVLIKQKREIAHRNVMLAAFGVSVAFLVCYLVYHVGVMQGKSTPFTGAGPVRYLYFTILISHIVLAAAVPFLAAANIYLGLADLRYRHRRLARWTFPIWLYVSITGVLIYWMLYHLYPPLSPTPIM
jgi:uncharacterized membrane protein YozB (DUF420 family)